MLTMILLNFTTDDLDFSLTDFDMDTEPNMEKSFQDFVDSAIRLSASPETNATSGSPRNLAASLGRQDTVSTLSKNSGDTGAYTKSSPAEPMESRRRGTGTFTSENSSLNQQPHNSIPTKKCSCFESDSDGIANCVYSSCQRDLTTLSTSTSGSKLKPGDYLPPLFIDTQNYGITNFSNSHPSFPAVPSATTSLPFPLEHNMYAEINNRQHVDIDVDNTHLLASAAATTATTMCNNSSCVLTPLSSPGFSESNIKKSLHRHEDPVEELTDPYVAETPSSQVDDSIDDLDIESISGFEKYLTEASLDLRALTSPSRKDSSISFSDSPLRSQPNVVSQTKVQERTAQDKVIKDGETDTSSVSALRLSILDTYSSKYELTSWLDRYALDALSTPPTSPISSPTWHEFADDQMEVERNSKQDTDILDLFSDDNAHAFLNDDSGICQMHISQFL